MLAKPQRLNLKKDFKRVASGKKLETKYLKLFIAKQPIKYGENVSPKVGIALSSKTFRKATDRNRAKRLIARAFHSTYHQLPTTINIVALPKVGILSVKSADVVSDLSGHMEEILKQVQDDKKI